MIIKLSDLQQTWLKIEIKKFLPAVSLPDFITQPQSQVLKVSFHSSIESNMPSGPGSTLLLPTNSIHPSTQPSLLLLQQLDSDLGASLIALQLLAPLLWMEPRGPLGQMLASCSSSCPGHSVTRWPLTSGPVWIVLVVASVWPGNPIGPPVSQ